MFLRKQIFERVCQYIQLRYRYDPRITQPRSNLLRYLEYITMPVIVKNVPNPALVCDNIRRSRKFEIEEKVCLHW
ncbi:hypothetical protein GJ496_006112 [Pomphorhynchus laevis]|nr:hypothetical protein GJ496_006112 [Pomphorhynchus laevis]